MTTEYGLTNVGFVPKTFEVIRDAMVAKLRGRLGPTIAADSESIEGIVVGTVCDELALLWATGQQIYSSQDPDQNTGQAQDAVCVITGTFREPPRKSAVFLTWTGTTGTSVLTGESATSIGTTPPVFATRTDTVLAAADAWAALTLYAIGDIVTNLDDTTPNIWYCSTGGTSVAGTGPHQIAVHLDGTVHDGDVRWVQLGEGEAFATVEAACTVTGPIAAPAGSLNQFVSFLAGVTGVTNILDATPGADVMSNEALRILREEEVATPGTGTVDAITAALLAIQDVTAATVFNNPTDFTDGDGVPAHSFECLVQGGDDQTIRDVILANLTQGIGTHGTTSGTAVDSQGTSHVIEFSRPAELDVYLSITIVKYPRLYPIDGASQVKQAILNFGFFQGAGSDIEPSAISAQAFKVPGVLRVSASPLVSVAPTTVPVSATPIVVTSRQIAKYDTGRMTVVESDGTP